MHSIIMGCFDENSSQNSDAQISECNRKIEQLQSSNQEFEKLNNERTEALQVFEDKTKALEEELAQLKQEVKDTKSTME